MIKFQNNKPFLVMALAMVFVTAGFVGLYCARNDDERKNGTINTILQDVDEQQTSQFHPVKNDDERSEEVDDLGTNNGDDTSTTSLQPAPSRNSGPSTNTPVQPNKPREETATVEEESAVKPTSEQTTPEVGPVPEQPLAVECAYRRLYGDKTPEELASSSPMVEFYYEQYQDMLRTYESYVKLYSNSTSSELTYKIVQAEFAKDKAYAMYEKELSSEVSRYSDMYAECN